MFTVKNPTRNDFSVTYDVNGDTNPVTFSVPAFDLVRFEDEKIGKHVAHHLTQHIVGNVEGVKTNYQDDYDRVYKEITVL
jgi:hypothetical protein